MIKGMASQQETAGLRRYTDAIAPYAIPVLRILVGITFFLTGLPKLTGLTGFTLFVASLGLPLPGFIAVIVAVMEVVGGLSSDGPTHTRARGRSIDLDLESITRNVTRTGPTA